MLGGKRENSGRPKGVPNKYNSTIKEMIFQALQKAGGVDYLAKQAKDNPAIFMTLLGKIIPAEITGGMSDTKTIIHKTAPLEGAERQAVLEEWHKFAQSLPPLTKKELQ